MLWYRSYRRGSLIRNDRSRSIIIVYIPFSPLQLSGDEIWRTYTFLADRIAE